MSIKQKLKRILIWEALQPLAAELPILDTKST